MIRVPIKPSALASKSPKRFADTESRDLRELCDQLYKELERKDGRNDKLSREVISLRTTIANQEVLIHSIELLVLFHI